MSSDRPHTRKLARNRRMHGEIGDISIAHRSIRLLKPSTYMNLSGLAVGAAMRYYKIEPERILVVYDEIDFSTGKIRLKFAGGHAGHNGVRDVIEHIGRDFWRLRIGVGHPGSRDDVVGHVLKRASADDETAIRDTIEQGIDMLPAFIEYGGNRAQHVLHTGNRPDSNNESEPKPSTEDENIDNPEPTGRDSKKRNGD